MIRAEPGSLERYPPPGQGFFAHPNPNPTPPLPLLAGRPAACACMDLDAEEGYRMGDKVEARFKGGTKWLLGRIIEVSRDGTFDVRYDDGDEERRVESRMIRKLGGSSSPRNDAGSDRERSSYRVGDKVEARYRGGSWHPGRITEKNRDGTF